MKTHAFCLLLFCSGCAAVPLATVGTAAGIASAAVSTGADVYRQGKLDAAELATLDDVHFAAHAASEELALTFLSEKSDDDKIDLRYEDDHGADVLIIIDRRTRALTHIRIDVGVFGAEPAARLMLQRIRFQLRSGSSTQPVPVPMRDPGRDPAR